MRLNNKVIVVTGANGLLGSNFCKVLLAEGAKVIALDLNDKNLIKMKILVHEMHIVDICDERATSEVADFIDHKYGRVDGLVNAAAINDSLEGAPLSLEDSKFENFPLTAWNAALNANLTSCFIMCKSFVDLLKKSKNASVVNIGSTYGIVAPDQSIYNDSEGKEMFVKGPIYSASKGGVIALTKYLASYWGKNLIRVNCLCPGGVENNQNTDFIENYSNRTPLGRMANISDYDGALVYMLSDESSYMTGSTLTVDGGWTTI